MKALIQLSPAEQQLSFGEEWLWVARDLGSNAPPFLDCPKHLSTILQLENCINLQALQRSVVSVLRRHAVLRTTIALEAGTPLRRLLELPLQPIDVCDLSERDTRSESHVLPDLLKRYVNEPFDLEVGPLFRARLFKLAGDAHVLAITLHHLVCDDWSRRIVLAELGYWYEIHAAERTSQELPCDVSYVDYVLWQRERARRLGCEQLISSWRAHIDQAQEVKWRGMEPLGPAVTAEQPGRVDFTVSQSAVSRLRLLARQSRATMATYLLAVLLTVLEEIQLSDCIAIGVPILDRPRLEFEKMIGMCTDVMIVCPRWPTVRRSVEHNVVALHAALLDASRLQGLPYSGFLVHCLKQGEPPSPFRVFYNFVNDKSVALPSFGGVRVSLLDVVHDQSANGDLSLHIRETSTELCCRLQYRRSVVCSSVAADLCQRMQAVIE